MAPSKLSSLKKDVKLKSRIRWVRSKKGRALQMNAGARATKKKFLWFLHADSRLEEHAISSLVKALRRDEEALYYFELQFLSDGPSWMFINEFGCWLRSRVMGVPFGDQGFCLSRAQFEKIGGFPVGADYGEDHLFVWRARQQGLRLRCTGAVLQTSARRYAQTGWAKLTWQYAHRWSRQAFPEWLKSFGVLS